MARRRRTSSTPKATLHTLAYPRRIVRYLLYIIGIGIVSGLLLVAGVYWGWFGPIPSQNELHGVQHHEATSVWSADGVILGKYYLENRIIVPRDKVSPWVSKALIATEDSRFFEHRGIDVISLGRVILRTLFFADRRQGGGSTLSQQLAKNLYPRERKGRLWIPIHKIKEMIIATRLERVYGKEELLHLYLNTVPFGDNIFGIEVAAQRYFAKSAFTVDLHQAAVLIGMLKGNTIYHPVKYPERAKDRRNVVLRRMKDQGSITSAQFKRYSEMPLDVSYTRESHHAGLATYFREHIRLEVDSILRDMKKEDGQPYNLYTDGLRIFTTLDARMQRIAEEGMATQLVHLQSAFDKEWGKGKPWGTDGVLEQVMRQSPRWKAAEKQGLDEKAIRKQFATPTDMLVFTWQGEVKRTWTPMDSLRYTIALLHAGILAGEPSSGAIKVWVGGISQRFFQYDQVKARRQVGSTFKPVVYAAALEAGFDPCDYFENRVVSYPEFEDWAPKNADGEEGGVYTITGALSQSLNTISSSLIMEIGTDPVKAVAKRMGVMHSLPDVPSIALGTGEMDLLDVLRIYGTLANEGVRPHWYYLVRIETADGQILHETTEEENKKRFERALTPEIALTLRHALQMAVDSGTAKALRVNFGLRGDLAGKTGTTQDHGDGWFAGFSSSLVAVSRVGATLPAVHFKSLRLGSGSRTALPLFGRLWRGCQEDERLKSKVLKPFNPLPEHVIANLQCPPYLPEYPEVASSSKGLLEFLGLRSGEEEVDSLDIPKPSEMAERIRKQQTKRRKKEERKEAWRDFWDGVMGR